ncbi:MAG: Plug domain-containing protein, partial [Gemmatimonadota bacterium]
TRDDIVRRQPRLLTEMLHQVPGGMVVSTPPHGYTLLLRGQCRPGIWLDGVPLSGVNSVDQLMSPLDVEAVEVYHGFELPVEFGLDSCGGILIWTRRGNPAAESEGTGWGILGSLLRAAALVAVILVLTR